MALPCYTKSSPSDRIPMSSSLWSWAVLGVSMGAGYCGLELLLGTKHANNNRNNNGSQRQILDRISTITSRFQASLRQVCDHPVYLFWWTAPLVSLRFWKTCSHYLVMGAFVTTVDSHDDGETKENATIATRAATAAINQDPFANNNNNNTANGTFAPLSPPKAKRQHQPHQQPQTSTHQAKDSKGRYLEILVHNISHTDLILGLEMEHQPPRPPKSPSQATTTTTNAAQPKPKQSASPYFLESLCLCRPRFSAFDMYCRKVLASLQQQQQQQQQQSSCDATTRQPPTNNNNNNNKLPADIIMVPQHRRSEFDPRYTLQPDAVLGNRPHVSVGFHFHEDNNSSNPSSTAASPSNKDNATLPSFERNGTRTMTVTQALADLRIRGKDMVKLVPPPPQEQPSSSSSSSPPEPSSPGSSWNVVPPPPTSIHQVLSSTSDALPEESPIQDQSNTMVELNAVFFPLLAALLPRWNALIATKYNAMDSSSSSSSSSIKKVLVLVTGVGTPRNWTHSMWGNSTEVLADLMEVFLARVYPDITVVKVHSDLNIFRYDDNITFVQQELLPCVNAYRDAHATGAAYPDQVVVTNEPGSVTSSTGRGLEVSSRAYVSRDARNRRLSCSNVNFHNKQYEQQQLPSFPVFDVDWKKSFSLTLSFADGSPARTHAIQTALRIFRPMYFHIWQLKTFWHERKIVDDDVEVHSFEEMETEPALESSVLKGGLQQVVEEMKAFRQEMVDTLTQPPINIDGCITCGHDINTFWLRKTHKPVLAVLLVQSPGQKPVLYRGTNMEVSMPTGSLCAERNVIGTALASNPSLKRQDLKCIAVLAVPLQQPQSNDGSASVASTDKKSRHESFDDTVPRHRRRRSSIDEDKEEEDWMVGSVGAASSAEDDGSLSGSQHDSQVVVSKGTPQRQIALFRDSSNSLVDMLNRHKDDAKPRTSMVGGKEKRTVIVRSNNNDVDLNPLRPCGACHEWLKKIAECNPYFQIVTFTDAQCNGVYVTSCQE